METRYAFGLASRYPMLSQVSEIQDLKGAAAPPAAGPFNSTLHTGDLTLGLNGFLFYFITYAMDWGPVEHGFPVPNLF